MKRAAPLLIHATAISMGGRGVIITGPPASGKSDLALRLIDRGAQLICDDIVEIRTIDGMPFLFQAPNIGGKLEIRGIGIVDIPAVDAVACNLVVMIGKKPERFYEKLPFKEIGGFDFPALPLNPFEPSAVIKVEYALNAAVDGNIAPVARLTGKGC